MKELESDGRTVEEAINLALNKLGADRDDVEVDVLVEGSKGLFGILGSRMARVKVVVKEDPKEIAKDFLNTVLDKMNIIVNTEVFKKDDYYYFSFTGENLGLLIGHRGETLDSLQYLTNLTVNRKLQDRVKIILDVEGYRKRREETLTRLAKRLIEKVNKTGKKVILEPMAPHERRIIHTTVQEDDSVSSFSEGNDPYRKVVIVLKK